MLIADLEALLAKATPGPWHVSDSNEVLDEQSMLVAAEIMGERPSIYRANAALIAATHTALPAILTALRAAEALPELLRKMADGSSPGYELACRDIAVIIEHRVLAALGEGK